jgi:hypothetical protein
MLRLGREAFEAGMEHLTEFFEYLERGFDRAEDLHRDVYGTDMDWNAYAAEQSERLVALRDMGMDEANSENPASVALRRTASARQAALEDQLGELLAKDAPQFIVDALGQPPLDRGEVASFSFGDPRWWHQYPEMQQPLTRRGLWQRVAGAYAAVIAGQCDGDPDAAADKMHATVGDRSSSGRAAYESFSSTHDLVHDFQDRFVSESTPRIVGRLI